MSISSAQTSTTRASAAEELRPIALKGSGLQLFPFAICRIAGQPFDDLDRFRSRATLRSIKRLHELEADLRHRKQDFADSLHQTVGSTSDETTRRTILSASRSLRRKNKLSTSQKEALLSMGDPALTDALSYWQGQQERVADQEMKIERTYGIELDDHRQQLGELIETPAFEKALALASPIVYRELRAQSGSSLPRRNRNQRRLEQSLLRYYARAATKTTPFSAFTAIGTALFDGSLTGPSQQPLIRLPNDLPSSAPELNKAFYAALAARFYEEPEIYPSFCLSLNPSFRQSASGYTFIHARNGFEKIVTLPPSSAMEIIVQTISEHGGTSPYRQLLHDLAEVFSIAPDQIRPRMDRLVESGVLLLNSGVADHDVRWSRKLQDSLRHSTDLLSKQICPVLDRLQQEHLRFPSVDGAGRLELLDRCRQLLAPLLLDDSGSSHGQGPENGSASAPIQSPATRQNDLMLEQRRSLKRNLFYEDTVLKTPIQLNAPRLTPAFEALGSWADWTRSHSLQSCHHANMRAYFDSRYPEASTVPFLDFYLGFFQQVHEKILRHERDSSQGDFRQVMDPFGLPCLSSAMHAANGLRRLIANRWQKEPNAESLHVDRQDLRTLSHPDDLGEGLASASCFVQPIPRSSTFEDDALLVDQQAVHAGMGRYFSRFLHRLDPRMTDALRAQHLGFQDSIVAELCDDGELSFNANLHPRLAAWEINYPARVTGLDPTSNLALTELDVSPHPERALGLQLVHRGLGKVVLPVDLGFANPLRRPPLFRVLALFSPFVFHRIEFPGTFRTTDDESAPTSITYRPRIVFERKVVLTRRRWSTPVSALRQVIAGKGAADAFRALGHWRAAHGLPEATFFHLYQDPNPAEGSSTSPSQTTHKPQYLSFAGALLCELLIEQVKNSSGQIIFEEVLPDPSTLPLRNGRPHATEFIVQLDRSAH